jgi:hypothetical protein
MRDQDINEYDTSTRNVKQKRNGNIGNETSGDQWTGAIEIMDGRYEVLGDEMRREKMQEQDESKGRGDV